MHLAAVKISPMYTMAQLCTFWENWTRKPGLSVILGGLLVYKESYGIISPRGSPAGWQLAGFPLGFLVSTVELHYSTAVEKVRFLQLVSFRLVRESVSCRTAPTEPGDQKPSAPSLG